MEEFEATAAEEAAPVEEIAEPTTAEETEVETAEDAGAEPEEKKSKGVQKRIDELVKQREDERRRAERLETMLEQMMLKQQTSEEVKTTPEPTFHPTRPKPTLEGCEFDTEKFAEELTDWKLEQREAKAAADRQKEQQAKSDQEFNRTFEEKRVATITAGKEKFDDFEYIVQSLPPDVLHVDLAKAIFETASPADVTYYLGKNPQEAARIAKLDPIKMALELGRLESKAIVPPKKKETTKAPDPVTPVGTNASANAEPDPSKDPEGWRKWEQERVRKLGRRY